MSQAITLQADLTIRGQQYRSAASAGVGGIQGGPRATIPSGTVLTFPDAVATGDFNSALDAAADALVQIGGIAALVANISQFNREVVVGGVAYQVTYGPTGQAIYTAQGAPPTLLSAVIENAAPTILVMTFDQNMVSPGTDYKTGFSVKVAAVARTISSSARQSNHAIIWHTLASAVTVGQAVLASYNIATGDLEDDAGAELQSFTDTAATNNTA